MTHTCGEVKNAMASAYHTAQDELEAEESGPGLAEKSKLITRKVSNNC